MGTGCVGGTPEVGARVGAGCVGGTPEVGARVGTGCVGSAPEVGARVGTGVDGLGDGSAGADGLVDGVVVSRVLGGSAAQPTDHRTTNANPKTVFKCCCMLPLMLLIRSNSLCSIQLHLFAVSNTLRSVRVYERFALAMFSTFRV